MMSLRSFAVLLALFLASSALAQAPAPATENVTVTSQKAHELPERVLHDFITAYATPAPAIGKITRWRYGVCPGVTGLPASWNSMIATRVRAVAAEAGAPVADAGCRTNIDIVFTKNPQMLLDGIRAKKPFLLGYHDLANEEKLARMTHPVQAWYMTYTVDATGGLYVDDKLHPEGIWFGNFHFPDAHVEHWYGTHLADGRRSELMHVLIVADFARINGTNLAAMADYVAMLSLGQTAAFETCQPMASITNLLSAGCDRKTLALSDGDRAYLHALYAIDPHDTLIEQQGKIAYEMKKSLGGQ